MEMPDIPDSIMTLVGYQYREATRFFRARFRKAKSPVNATQYDFLRLIWQLGGKYCIEDSGEKIGRARSTVSRGAIRLERGGYVVGHLGEDLRRKYISITDAGKAIVIKYAPVYKKADTDYREELRLKEGARADSLKTAN